MAYVVECLPSGLVRERDRVVNHGDTVENYEQWLRGKGYEKIDEEKPVWAKRYYGEWTQPLKIC